MSDKPTMTVSFLPPWQESELPVLYVIPGDPDSQRAEELLHQAGFAFKVERAAPVVTEAYSCPVLFTPIRIFEGLKDVEAFIGVTGLNLNQRNTSS